MEHFLSWNLRASAIRVELTDTLTRESQEVMVGLIVVRTVPIDVVVVDPKRMILGLQVDVWM